MQAWLKRCRRSRERSRRRDRQRRHRRRRGEPRHRRTGRHHHRRGLPPAPQEHDRPDPAERAASPTRPSRARCSACGRSRPCSSSPRARSTSRKCCTPCARDGAHSNGSPPNVLLMSKRRTRRERGRQRPAQAARMAGAQTSPASLPPSAPSPSHPAGRRLTLADTFGTTFWVLAFVTVPRRRRLLALQGRAGLPRKLHQRRRVAGVPRPPLRRGNADRRVRASAAAARQGREVRRRDGRPQGSRYRHGGRRPDAGRADDVVPAGAIAAAGRHRPQRARRLRDVMVDDGLPAHSQLGTAAARSRSDAAAHRLVAAAAGDRRRHIAAIFQPRPPTSDGGTPDAR